MADNTPNLSRLFQTAGTQKQQTGTGFTNLNRLFSANQGNQLGQKVAGDVQKQVGNVQSQLGQQQQEFQTESEKNKLGSTQDIAKRDEIIGRFAPSSGNDSNKPQATLSDTDVSEFGRFTGGQYAGPQGLRDTGSLQNTAAQLKGQVSNFSPSGTQELLRRSVGGNKYTQGQQRLDTLLMDKSQLTPVQRQASALGQNINRANLAASGQAELNKNLAQRFGEETKGQLITGMSGIETAVKGQLTAAEAQEKDRLSKIQQIQQFAQNKVPKLDASGNPVLDQYGKPVYDTAAKARGDGDIYTQQDYLKNLLSSQGAQQSEIEQIFGTRGAKDISKQFEAEAARVAGIKGGFWGTDNNQKENLLRQAGVPESEIVRIRNESLRTYGDIGSGRNWSSFASKGLGLFDNQASNVLGSQRSQELARSAGLAGQSLGGGTQDQFYKNLASTLAQSKGAQGLTEQGIASGQQRASYEALNKLLGKTASESKYRTDDPTKYEAGNLLLNPEQLKRTL